MKEAYIIMIQSLPLQYKFFESEEAARNFIKMQYPNRKFKEPEHNKFICTHFGTTLKIIKLQKH